MYFSLLFVSFLEFQVFLFQKLEVAIKLFFDQGFKNWANGPLGGHEHQKVTGSHEIII